MAALDSVRYYMIKWLGGRCRLARDILHVFLPSTVGFNRI